MTVMSNDVSLPPRINDIAGFQLFPINLIGKHSHFPLIINDQILCQQTRKIINSDEIVYNSKKILTKICDKNDFRH